MAKRRFGDRKDGTQVRDLDGLHFIMPIIYPKRCDNEAYISERIDLTNIMAYIEKKNAGNPAYHYTFFEMIAAAFLKTVYLRPKMNRFITNRTLFQRNYLSTAFMVKKQYADDGAEGIAFIYADGDTTMDSIHEKIRKTVQEQKKGGNDQSSDMMDLFVKAPHFLSRTIVRFICFLDRHGWVPKFLIETDPNYSSVFLTNLGSIKLKSGYHHLSNWGTNSLFVVVGEKKKRYFMDDNGESVLRESVDIGLTVDERIADGYYYSKSIRLLKKLLENPELLEKPFSEKVEY